MHRTMHVQHSSAEATNHVITLTVRYCPTSHLHPPWCMDNTVVQWLLTTYGAWCCIECHVLHTCIQTHTNGCALPLQIYVDGEEVHTSLNALLTYNVTNLTCGGTYSIGVTAGNSAGHSRVNQVRIRTSRRVGDAEGMHRRQLGCQALVPYDVTCRMAGADLKVFL